MEKKHQLNRFQEELPSSKANIRVRQHKQKAKPDVEPGSEHLRMQTKLDEPQAKTFRQWELECKYLVGVKITDERNQGLPAVEEPQMYGFSFRVLPLVVDVFQDHPKTKEPHTDDVPPSAQNPHTGLESPKPEATNDPPVQDQALETPEGKSEEEVHPGAATASRSKAEDEILSKDPTFFLRACVHAVVKQFFIESDAVFPGVDIKSISRRIFKKVYKEVKDVDLSNTDMYNDLNSTVYSALIAKWGVDNLQQIIINLTNAVTDNTFVSCFTKLLKPKKEPSAIKNLVLNAGQRFKTFLGM